MIARTLRLPVGWDIDIFILGWEVLKLKTWRKCLPAGVKSAFCFDNHYCGEQLVPGGMTAF
jgi:hypothetical protein